MRPYYWLESDHLNRHGGTALVTQYAIILAFAIIGAGIKFIDDAFDEALFSKKFAILIAPFLVIIWILLSVADPISAIILFSILFSVLLTGKIDNFVFKTCALALILLFVSTGRFGSFLMPLLILIVMGLLDEEGNDYVDKNKTNRVVEFFFLHRFSMKLGVLALCLSSVFPWLYLFAFLTFDMAYDSVGIIGQKDWRILGLEGREDIEPSPRGIVQTENLKYK